LLFNSYTFVFLFLPATLVGFFVLAHQGYKSTALAWLVIASLVFYGWWTPTYILLLAGSIVFNYGLGLVLGRGPNKLLLTLGIAANLICLGYYKYAAFIVGNVSDLVGTNLVFEAVILPLAISFFTFQQVAYLVDAHRGLTREYSFLRYALFVTFFPQLIIGPIVHHSETIPQFQKDSTFRFRKENIEVGLPIFIIGLFKKVIFADTIARYIDPSFALAAQGGTIGFADAWVATIGFCFQLYFDFSSYSDMAIGLGRMFGIRLPLNFASPLRQSSIIRVWRQWHMTLYRFFRDYVFIPLGGRERGPSRLAVNVMIVMVLSGIWHGSGWKFVCLGLMNGFWLLVELEWRRHLGPRLTRLRQNPAWIELSRVLAFLAFASSLPFFRAADFPSSIRMFEGMLGLNGMFADRVPYVELLDSQIRQFAGLPVTTGLEIALIFGVVFAMLRFAPSTQHFMRHYEPALDFDGAATGDAGRLAWRPSRTWGIIFGILGGALLLALGNGQEFIYFQF